MLTDPITIDRVYPWGRSFDEYRRMFDLSDRDLDRRIVCCADGPASFNAAMARRGRHVVSCDPLYRYSAAEIRARISATHPILVGQAHQHADRFVWDAIGSPEDLGRLRMSAMDDFLADYDLGARQGRYITCSLPHLPFADDSFDLALCSHFLFLYSDEFPLQFHLDAAIEMSRLARDVRIFPLLNLRGQLSPHLPPTIEHLRKNHLTVERKQVPYEFQRGGNEMLHIQREAS